jgi:hypothetical protein
MHAPIDGELFMKQEMKALMSNVASYVMCKIDELTSFENEQKNQHHDENHGACLVGEIDNQAEYCHICYFFLSEIAAIS